MRPRSSCFTPCYLRKDGKYISIGSIEPQFYELLKEKAQLSLDDFGMQMNPAMWPEQKQKMEAVFKSKTRDEWCEIMEGSDVCFAPVLGLAEAPSHPHNVARNSFIEVEGVVQHAPI